MTFRFIGKKQTMTELFDKQGNVIPCTAILLDENIIVRIKNVDKDGYNAIQVGTGNNKKPKKRNNI